MPRSRARPIGSRSLAAVLALSLALAPTAALAQPGDPPTKAELDLARSLYYDGIELMDAGKWAESADRLERVLAIRDSVVVSYQLANAYTKLERFVDARRLLEKIKNTPDAAPEVHDAATKLLPEVEGQMGRLTLELSGELDGAVVFIGGHETPSVALGVPVPVDPGDVVVSVKRDDEEVASASAIVEAGASATIKLEVPPAGGPEPEPVVLDEAVAAPILLPVPEPEPIVRQRSPLGHAPARRDSDDDDAGLLGQWWFWTAVGVVAAGTVVTVMALGAEGEPADLSSVRGDFEPGLLEGKVSAP